MSRIWADSSDVVWSSLTGKIESLVYNEDEVRIITDQGKWLFKAEGVCCARAYLDMDKTTKEEVNALVGQTIVKAEVLKDTRQGDTDEDGYGNVHDIHWYAIQGDTSRAVLTLHVTHNGYYGGSLEPYTWED